MHELSTDEVVALGERFGVPVDDAEADAVRAGVNEFLGSLEALDDLPLPAREPAGPERTWAEPTDDPHNAVAVDCEVRPPADAGTDLDGVEVGVKDIVAVAGVPMQCSSAVMAGFVPGTDAAVVERLLGAGASVTAVTNCDEFAASASGVTPRDGPTTNPHDADRTAGGSSGGSAVAVATGRVDVALGTDTGGSVRIPASYCGVVGVKPTYGLVPLHGVVENTYTQDHVGPLARTVGEAAAVLDAIAGPDERDPASLQAAGREGYRCGGYAAAVADGASADDLSLGVLEPGLGDGVADAVAARTEAALDRLEDAGAAVRRKDLEGYDAAPAVKNALSVTELAAHWRDGGAPYRRGGVVDPAYQADLAARADARAAELGPYYKQKLLAGAHVVEAHRGGPYVRAQAAREVLRERFEAALEGVDALVAPTTPDVAPPVDEAAAPGVDPGLNTRPADVTRLPAVSVPNGTHEGLPVGVQLVGPAFGERDLLAAAAAVEATLAA